MAWEWVAPVTTGAVGIAGIAGTYLTSWSGQRAAADLARFERNSAQRGTMRTEKRETYIEFLSTLERVNTYLLEMQSSRSGELNGDGFDAMLRAYRDVSSGLAELAMVASDQVMEAARECKSDSIKKSYQALHEEFGVRELNSAMIHKLVDAMRSDLGDPDTHAE